MSEELSREEVHYTVDRAIEDLLVQCGIDVPPVDAVAMTQRLGLIVTPPRTRNSARRETPPRSEPSPLARQWLAAQAIGEHLKPSLLERLGIPHQGGILMGESLPTLIASHLLLPAAWFGDDVRALESDVLELTKRYTTAAPDLVAWRLLDLPTPCVITIVDNDHVQRRRSNGWRVRRQLEEPERECQRYVNHFSRPRVVCADGWTVQGWPVHRSDWKREILRSVCDRDPDEFTND